MTVAVNSDPMVTRYHISRMGPPPGMTVMWRDIPEEKEGGKVEHSGVEYSRMRCGPRRGRRAEAGPGGPRRGRKAQAGI